MSWELNYILKDVLFEVVRCILTPEGLCVAWREKERWWPLHSGELWGRVGVGQFNLLHNFVSQSNITWLAPHIDTQSRTIN